MKAVGRKLIIKVDEQPEKIGRIIIPKQAQQAGQVGIIQSRGDSDDIPTELFAGVKVLFNKYGVTEFEQDGEKFVSVDCDGVVAIMD